MLSDLMEEDELEWKVEKWIWLLGGNFLRLEVRLRRHEVGVAGSAGDEGSRARSFKCLQVQIRARRWSKAVDASVALLVVVVVMQRRSNRRGRSDEGWVMARGGHEADFRQEQAKAGSGGAAEGVP